MSAILILFPKKIPAIKTNPSTIDFQPLQYSFKSFISKAAFNYSKLISHIAKQLASIGKHTIPHCMPKEIAFLSGTILLSIHISIHLFAYMHPDPVNPSNASTCAFCQQTFDYRTLPLFSPASFFSFYSTQWIYVIENALGEAEYVSAYLQSPEGT